MGTCGTLGGALGVPRAYTSLGRGFFYNFIFKIKKSVSLFCASTGGLSRRYLKTNHSLYSNSELFLKGHLQVGLILYVNVTDSFLANYFRSRNHCRQEIINDPRCFCSPAHPPPFPPPFLTPLCVSDDPFFRNGSVRQ